MRIKAIFITAIMVFSQLGAKPQEASLHSLLPDPSLMEGWYFSRDPECFRGDELFDLINGGADLYYEYAFVKVFNAQYTEESGSKIQFEVYEMDSDSSAYGIFSSIYNSAEVNNTIGLYSVVNDQYIAFVKDRFYVNIAWVMRKNARQESLLSLARMVEENISVQGQLPALLRALEDVETKGIPVYFRGNIALSNVYYFDFRDYFQIDQGVAFKGDDLLKLVFSYPDDQAAQDVFSGLHDLLEKSRRFTDIGMIYQGYTCSDNKGNHLVFRLGPGFITVMVAYDDSQHLMPPQEAFFQQVKKALNP